jgi:hypothetical protein
MGCEPCGANRAKRVAPLGRSAYAGLVAAQRRSTARVSPVVGLRRSPCHFHPYRRESVSIRHCSRIQVSIRRSSGGNVTVRQVDRVARPRWVRNRTGEYTSIRHACIGFPERKKIVRGAEPSTCAWEPRGSIVDDAEPRARILLLSLDEHVARIGTPLRPYMPHELMCHAMHHPPIEKLLPQQIKDAGRL